MGRITSILSCQWRAYWRRLARPGTLTASNQGILLILGVLVFVKYVRALSTASAQLSVGNTAMFERLLLGVFIVWWFPLLSNARISITTRALRHFPVTLKELFVIRAGSLFIPPLVWMIVAASIGLVYPLIQAPNPIAGVVALLLFVVTAWLLGLTVSQLVSVAVGRKRIVVGILGLLTIAVIAFVREGDRLDLADRLSVVSTKLVANPALGQRLLLSFGLLVALLTISAIAALWSFRASLQSVDTGKQQGRTFSLLSGRTGPLSVKDLRYFRRLLDPYLGLLVSAGGCFYLVMADQPAAEVFWIFIILVFFPSASLTFNSFGLDSQSGLDRYHLLPLSGREIVLSKNTSFLLFVSFQLAPMVLLAAWQLGLGPTFLGIIESSLVAVAYMTWGNLIAVGHRFRMEFFRFSSGGAPIDALAGVIFGSLPGAIAIRLFGWGHWWVIIAMVVVYSGMYWASLVWSGRKFDRVTL
jgi:hypothetical protein